MELTDEERRRAAMGCRAAAHIAEADAEKQTNSMLRATFEQEARKYRLLAQKFDKASRE